ncbi:MAG: glycosyltransferase, partial [Eggerthellaceae bacterium]|nr:glycosyltransferase [Eggerthellaceae bacterium]
VVHLNMMNGAGLVYAPIAKVHKVPRVVAHARNSRFGVGHRMAKTMVHILGRAIGAPAADARLAVSREAGRFMFGDRAFSVLKRGIDMGRYAFDLTARSRLREQLGIGPDTFVVGNIGRVSQAKNPLFQVGVFAEFHRRVPDSLLLLVGDGELRAQRDDEIRRLGLEESVVVRSASPNPAPYYFAMDCLIVPSLYEGLPNTVLEAQCAGLSVLASDTITEEAFATSIAYSCPLDIGESGWAQVLEEIYGHCGEIDRMRFAKELGRAGFTSKAMHASLQEAYAL